MATQQPARGAGEAGGGGGRAWRSPYGTWRDSATRSQVACCAVRQKNAVAAGRTWFTTMGRPVRTIRHTSRDGISRPPPSKRRRIACLAAGLLFAACGRDGGQSAEDGGPDGTNADAPAPQDASAGTGGSSAVAGSGGGPVSSGGSSGTGGGSSTGGRFGTGGSSSTGGASETGGAPGQGGAAGEAAGAGGSGGGGGTSLGGRSGTGGRSAGGGGAPASSTGGAGGRVSATGGAGGAGAAGPITIWLAGDSMMATGTAPCPIGWGGQFQPLFLSTATVVNSAVAGRSIRTWLYDVQTTMDASGECVLAKDAQGNPTLQARWQTMLDKMKVGDYLLIQFGINDSSATCDRHVGAAAFQDSLTMMADAAKTRGAHAIFITPVSSIACNSSNMPIGTRGTYSTATKSAGTKAAVPVIDLEALSVALYAKLGFCPIPGGDVTASTTGPVGDFFCDDHTHFSATGAPQIAALVAQALRTQGLPLGQYLK